MLAGAAAIFGSIGLVRRLIPLDSALIACVRGFVGAAFLLLFLLTRGGKLSRSAIRANGKLLVISGAAIGLNWILLFEAYNYTTVAVATLCYYMSPVFVMLLSPFLLGEKLTRRKLICVLTALFGMVLVSGIFSEGVGGAESYKGVLFGLGAAVLYASIIMMNQRIREIPTYDKTIVQLLMAAIVALPYVLATQDFAAMTLTASTVILLLVAGIVHTGVAYALYFGSMDALSAQTVALYGYIDPAAAILLSAFVLKEALDVFGIIGAVLILGATLASELGEKET